VADARAAAASRVMSLGIAAISLLIAALATARRLIPALDAQMDGWGLALTAAVVAIVVGTYAAAMRLALRPPVPQT
jgi:hypothetical protein